LRRPFETAESTEDTKTTIRVRSIGSDRGPEFGEGEVEGFKGRGVDGVFGAAIGDGHVFVIF
jgi:hypothetical protein